MRGVTEQVIQKFRVDVDDWARVGSRNATLALVLVSTVTLDDVSVPLKARLTAPAQGSRMTS